MNAHQRRVFRRAFTRRYGAVVPCLRCIGGWDGDEICFVCNGRGLIYEHASIALDVNGIARVFPVVA